MGLADWFSSRRAEPSVPAPESISFDTTGWDCSGAENGRRQWTTPHGDSIVQWISARSKPYPHIEPLDQFRQAVISGLSSTPLRLVELSLVSIDGCPVIRMIRKAPQSPSGMTYTGTLSFCFRDFAPVIAVMCLERGITGLRETILLDQLLQAGEVTITDPPNIAGDWNPDDQKYDP